MYLIFDHIGRVTQQVETSDPGYAKVLVANGLRFVKRGSGLHDTYVDLADPERPVERMRPILEDDFDKTELVLSEIATHTGLPACTIMITGPSQNGAYEHKGGDLKLRFLLPGVYTVAFEPFPYQRREISFQVSAQTEETQS